MNNIPMNKYVLSQFLGAGYIEKGKLNKLVKNNTGVPQGGIISPVVANMVLDGLQTTILNTINSVVKKKEYRENVKFVRYADDFLVSYPIP